MCGASARERWMSAKRGELERLWRALLGREYEVVRLTEAAPHYDAITLERGVKWLFRRSPRFERSIFPADADAATAASLERLEGPGQRALVGGAPGQGRSSYINYLLLRYARRRRRVYLHAAVDRIMARFDSGDGSVRVEDDFMYVNAMKAVAEPGAVLLGNYLEGKLPLAAFMPLGSCASVSFVAGNGPHARHVERYGGVSLKVDCDASPLLAREGLLDAIRARADPPVPGPLGRGGYERVLRRGAPAVFEEFPDDAL